MTTTEGRPHLERPTAPNTRNHISAAASQQVSWWPVHEFVAAVLAQPNYGPLPWPGTPAWCELAVGDHRKLLALAQFGEHHALRVETAQAARAEASRAIAAAADWLAISRAIRRRQEFRAAHPWAKRVTL
ncbi:DUF2742 domain-containing protein [Mycobacterium sp.]|uniref:DUF2742 domain-containing protein n=1 Tax=Mycobacterium sp. TaxID=1785 RepID=UPI0031DF8FE2